MTEKFAGNLASLARGARDQRAQLEAETRAKVDGRTLRQRRGGRTEQLGVRVTPEARERLERLSMALGLSFGEVMERALVVLEKQARGR
jgi:DNA-binding TFAR19-related protein (PDSD5 family)